ncbi:hypothetical protein KDD93_07235 [Campylobacter sp. faydin G-24]|uniref:PspA/IM30 family protein n=1 Tax=Campylobacter anatolicus TaxID=2829105 RepID=A0ABS5HJA9_9BACT|nr:hypothetical protein [Campylobacter anatolicus]MBR8464354.1 hypothetical protein [Campylobacter anatolicus]MBR8464954.1 hypothetical protein [Campylobacter anatolicus]
MFWKTFKKMSTRIVGSIDNVVASLEAGTEYLKAEALISLDESLSELNLTEDKIKSLKDNREKLKDL